MGIGKGNPPKQVASKGARKSKMGRGQVGLKDFLCPDLSLLLQ
jgi:hypothetical protein